MLDDPYAPGSSDPATATVPPPRARPERLGRWVAALRGVVRREDRGPRIAFVSGAPVAVRERVEPILDPAPELGARAVCRPALGRGPLPDARRGGTDRRRHRVVVPPDGTTDVGCETDWIASATLGPPAPPVGGLHPARHDARCEIVAEITSAGATDRARLVQDVAE